MSTERSTAAKKPRTKKPAAKKTTARARTAKPRSRSTSPSQAGPYSTTSNRLSLLALSPYRFPLDVERLALHSVRIGGFAFVLFGLIFTYNYIESTTTNLVLEATQTANVITAAEERTRLTPPVQFSYAPVDGTEAYTITVETAKADAVTLFAFNPTVGEYERLGEAQQAADNTWVYTWDTTNTASGQYWVKAMVENRHGVYDRSDSTYFTVE